MPRVAGFEGTARGHEGVNPHGSVRCEAHERKALERLRRNITNTALSHEKVQPNAAGRAVLKLKTSW